MMVFIISSPAAVEFDLDKLSWCMSAVYEMHPGRKIDRVDKELTVICDLSGHTLTYKGNPTAGGYTHAPTDTHAQSWLHQIRSGVTLH